MKTKLINSQLNNFKTYLMYKRQMLTMAENVFLIENLPEFIDISYVNKILVNRGAIAFFKDEILGVLALPFKILGKLDVYGRPLKIQVYGRNGYRKTLNIGEFVIMYDNNGKYPIFLDILQYAERISLDTRTGDINIQHQKTPRIWKTTQDKVKTINDLVNNVDAFAENVVGYEDLLTDDTTIILQPAPFVADKIDIHKEKIWNEFLRFIGVANMNFQKKERNIKDEVQVSQGGTIASRWSRFEPRKKAIEQINKKFDLKLKVKYYDGMPSTEERDEEDEVYDESIFN